LKKRKMKKIIVVGAGPAGSSCAAKLAERGLDVTVIDKTKNFEDRVCGGAIGPSFLNHVKIPKITSLRPIRGICLYSPDGCAAVLDSSQYDRDYLGWIFDRNEFDKKLATIAEQRGAELVLNERVYDVSYEKYDDSFVVYTDKASYRADIVVDASGASARIAKKFGIVRDLAVEEYRITVQAIIENSNFLPRRDYVCIYFGNKYATKSYAWVFPDGDDRIKVGLGVPKGVSANTHLHNFIHDKQIEGIILSWKGKIVPLAKTPPDLVGGPNDSILAVGDAARLCDALTGGGIATAMISGECAARAISEGHTQRYNEYLRRIRQVLWRRWFFSRFVSFDDETYRDIVAAVDNYSNTFFKSNLVDLELTRLIFTFLREKSTSMVADFLSARVL